MLGSGSVKPPKPPPPPELPAQLVDPVVQRAAMFARVGRWSGAAGTRVAGRWRGRGLAFRVLRPGQTGFASKRGDLVGGATTVGGPAGPGATSPSPGGSVKGGTVTVKAGPVSTSGGVTHAVVKPSIGRSTSYTIRRGKRVPVGGKR